MDRTSELREVRQRLQEAYRQAEQELEAARRLQRAARPAALPEVAPLRLGVYHRPCGRAGGDSHDAFRLGENHVGLYLADVMAHGVTAALLTLFLRPTLRPADEGRESPERVLRRVNAALLELELPETPFVGLIHARVHLGDGTLCFARAGLPAPVYLPRDGAAERWPVSGSLLGVFATEFPLQTRQLRPGDKVIFTSDGLCPAAENVPAGTDQLLACAAELRARPIAELVAQLGQQLSSQSDPADDVTLFGIEWDCGTPVASPLLDFDRSKTLGENNHDSG
jgi:sigma-B regulation protein RsbU (phosphoserine phosphatase)